MLTGRIVWAELAPMPIGAFLAVPKRCGDIPRQRRLKPDRVMALTILLALVEAIRRNAPGRNRTAARCHRA